MNEKKHNFFTIYSFIGLVAPITWFSEVYHNANSIFQVGDSIIDNVIHVSCNNNSNHTFVDEFYTGRS